MSAHPTWFASSIAKPLADRGRPGARDAARWCGVPGRSPEDSSNASDDPPGDGRCARPTPAALLEEGGDLKAFLVGKVLRQVRQGLGQREPPGAAP